MDSKALSEVVRVFTARQPFITASPKAIYTPPVSSLAAIMALCRFLRPSESGLTMGYWEPVSTTGISISLSIKESIDAVYAIVSVPWVITMPEQLSRAFITALAICCHSSGH